MPERTPSAAPAQLHSGLSEELRMEGIAFMGYGVLPKYVMLDSALTLEAKGIYAYLCAFTGQGNTAFPGRERILADLGINKDTYYRHYDLLLAEGYVQVQQQRCENGFSRNIYTLVSSPEKFRHDTEKTYLEKTYAVIRASGLKAAGYGFIAKAVMTDRRLSLKAKGLYAYFCAFTGAGESAHPSVDTARAHLGISRTLYAKYTGELRALNYVAVTQRITAGGRFGVNDVTIVDTPDLSNAATAHSYKKETGVSPCIDFSDTGISDTQISDAGISVTRNRDMNKTQPEKNNNAEQQQNFHHQQRRAARGPERTAENSEETVFEVLRSAETIPAAWLGDRGRVGECLRLLTDYDLRREEETADTEPGSTYLLFLEALTDMLCARQPMKLTEDHVTARDVAERLTRYLRHSASRGTLVLCDLEELVRESYEEGCRSQTVRNPLGYCKACIWTALKTGDAALRAQIAHDLGY